MLKFIVISCFIFGAVNLTGVSHYETLGVTKKASSQEIRQAYKKLAVKFHPDKNSKREEQEIFLKITEAYETLKDPEKRHKYDLYGPYTYTRKYNDQSQAEYDHLYYNGLYHDDEFVDNLSGADYYDNLEDGFHFINFYSPFCPPCQNVADHWKTLAEIYKGIVKIGAVNCKRHNSFCYNNMRIGSYPSLLFYPNGKNSNYVYYRGERTLEALDEFLMVYLKNQVHVPTVTKLRSVETPMAYVLGSNRIDRNTLTRIAYHLNGLVTVVIVDDDTLRSKLARDEYTTVVFKYNKIAKEIESTEEKEIIKEIVDALPTTVDLIGPEKLKEIRNNLRNGFQSAWVLFFSSKGAGKLQLYQMNVAFPHFNFGEVDCDKWGELCASLHVQSAPAWGVLKQGGAYQRAHSAASVKQFIRTATAARSLHTLSASELNRILDGEMGTWVLLVVPPDSKWSHIAEPFTRASQHFTDSENINFGIMSCTPSTEEVCGRVSHTHPSVLLQNGTRRHYYSGQQYDDQLVDFVVLLRESADMELNEQQVLEILDAESRQHWWLVAFLPQHCGALCDQLQHQWRIVAQKLRPLDYVRVRMLNCALNSGGFCANIRSPTVRLYPIASSQHYSASLQHLAEAPYMLEWALGYIDESVKKLHWQAFTKKVIVEELNPTSGKKPWLVYFHSPRCYRCYEMYTDFAIAGIMLQHAVELGKVNCINERSLCQHEQVMSYPSLKLYMNRNQNQRFSTVVNIQLRDYESILRDIKAHLRKYDENLLAGIDTVATKHFDIKHDEF